MYQRRRDVLSDFCHQLVTFILFFYTRFPEKYQLDRFCLTGRGVDGENYGRLVEGIVSRQDRTDSLKWYTLMNDLILSIVNKDNAGAGEDHVGSYAAHNNIL